MEGMEGAKMKLNREQMIKALECWVKNFDGKVTKFTILCEALNFIKKQDELIFKLENRLKECENGYEGTLHLERCKLHDAEEKVKELTQANEQLSDSYDHLEKTKDELLSERAVLIKENEMLRVVSDMSDTTLTGALRIVNEFCNNHFKRAKADIVKEMQEKIKQRMDDFARIDGGEQTFYLISKSVIDQIAKEILEEK